MAPVTLYRLASRNWALAQSDSILTFLAPAAQPTLVAIRQGSVARFSTSPALWKKDNNKNRAVSALRRTGPRRRQTLSVLKEEIPVPVLDPKQKSDIKGAENHGLWGFFNKDKKLLSTPDEEVSHGRAWTVEELRQKSWDDLHCLWWVCVKERNRIATEMVERNRLKLQHGNPEAEDRVKVVKATQRAIMTTLTERWYAWEEARKVAKADEEVDLTGEGPAYTPSVISEEEYFEPEFDEAGPQDLEGQAGDRPADEQLEKANELKESELFNPNKEPATLQEKVKAKVTKVLWNK